MTRQEVAKILFTISTEYKQEFKGYTTQELDEKLSLWCSSLNDYTYAEASEGLKVYLVSNTTGFAPKVGQIIDCIQKIKRPVQYELTQEEAWVKLQKAVSNSSYHSAEEYDKLPELVKKIVVNPDNLRRMAAMDSDEFHTVEKSHFYRSFRTIQERQREDAKLPASVRTMIEMSVGMLEGV